MSPAGAHPRVVVVFTGGTISMLADPVTGAVLPALDGAAILARTPGLDAIAHVEPIDWDLLSASHLRFDHILDIARVLRDALARPDVDGAVVVQGTDTIEETAFAWDLLLDSPKPVVVTGAMRTPDRPDYDGPSNLRGAVAAAASAALRDQGVVVSLAGSLEAADDVIKLHTAALDTFQSPNGGSLGRVGEDGVRVTRRRGPRRRHDQGGADRRALRRLHPGGPVRHARRLRVAPAARLDHGLRWPGGAR